MHPYLTHLLSDITAAHRREEDFYKEVHQTIEQHFEDIEKWLVGEEPAHTFSYYCGLEAVNFPPAEQLSALEMKKVCKAFRKMMCSWNLDIELPEKLPIAIAYRMMVDTLNEKTEIPNSGFIGFDFCTGYAPDCIFKEYCLCLEIWNENDDISDADLPENELPF